MTVTGVALTLTVVCAVASSELPRQPESIFSKLMRPAQTSAFSGLLDTDRSFNRLIIKFKDSATTRAGVFDHRAAENQVLMLSFNTKLRNPNTRVLTRLKSLSDQTHVALTDIKMTRSEIFVLVKQLEQDPSVAYAEIDETVQTSFAPNDPFYATQQWHLQAAITHVGGTNLPNAWSSATGSGVVVAVIDTGVLPHVDLVSNLLPGYDFISQDNPGVFQTANDGDGRDSDASDPGDWQAAGACGPGSLAKNSSWHGTHVAGTVAALTNNGVGVAGVAFGSKVLPVRVLGVCGGFASDIAAGMRWAAGLNVPGVPDNINKAKVLNLSLGSSARCHAVFQDVIIAVRTAGSVVVAATGNDFATTIATPANCAGVIAVTAHTQLGDKANYANTGSGTQISAPGGGFGTLITGSGARIYSTLNTGLTIPSNDFFSDLQGTSMATPHVAGVAALLASLQPDITPDALQSVLMNSARAFPASTYCVVRNDCGAGMLDAKLAIDRLNSLAPTVSTSLISGVRLTGSTVALTGVATPKVGGNAIFSYQWTQLSGPSITLLTATTASASFVAATQAASYAFALRATDGSGLAATSQVAVTTNTAPVLAIVPDQSVVVGANLTFTAAATDAESNPITYVDSGLPSGAALNPNTGVFTWNNASPVGDYSFTITPSDGIHSGSLKTVSIAVTAPTAASGGGGGGLLGIWDLLGMLALSLLALTSFRRQSAKK